MHCALVQDGLDAVERQPIAALVRRRAQDDGDFLCNASDSRFRSSAKSDRAALRASGYVPSVSTGFCVASTKNGCGSGRRLTFERDLVFLHHFEQRALRFRRRAIDFIGQQNLREHRAFDDAQFARLRIQHRVARDVGRHHVRRELHTRVVQRQALAIARGRAGLAEAGHAFDQRVTRSDQSDDDLFDDLVLSDDGLADGVRAACPVALRRARWSITGSMNRLA